MREYLEVFSAVGLGLGLAMVFVQGAVAQQNPVTAIDIALEPDAAMIQRAKADNARLLKSFSKGFLLDATHHPHVTMLQQFVRTDDLDRVFAAANAVLAKEKPRAWTLKAFKTTTFPIRRSAWRESSSNRPKTCIGCKMHSSKLLRPTP